MARLILGRLAWGLGLVLIVSALVFAVFDLLPTGDPALTRPGITADQAEVIRESLGSDRSAPVQYVRFLKDLLHLDLGRSYREGTPVSGLIVERLPATFILITLSMLIWMVLGVLAGTLAAAAPRRWIDRLGGALSILLISTPVFVLGYLALWAFAAGVGWVVPFLPGVGAYADAEGLVGRVAALALPSLVLGLGAAGLYFRLSRASMRDELSRDYVLAARARGLRPARVLWNHAFRTGLTPMLTLIGLDFALIAAGNVILVEAVFNVPGVGGLMVSSIQQADLPVVQALVLLTAILVIVVNILVDIAQMLLDPRVRRVQAPPSRHSPIAAPPVRGPSTSSGDP